MAREILEKGCNAFEEGDIPMAVYCFERAARLGNGEAQVNLANIYSDGAEGVEKNSELAVHWYHLAAKKGIPEAAYNLAIHYLRDSEEVKYKKWILKASSMGDVDAQEAIKKVKK